MNPDPNPNPNRNNPNNLLDTINLIRYNVRIGCVTSVSGSVTQCVSVFQVILELSNEYNSKE